MSVCSYPGFSSLLVITSLIFYLLMRWWKIREWLKYCHVCPPISRSLYSFTTWRVPATAWKMCVFQALVHLMKYQHDFFYFSLFLCHSLTLFHPDLLVKREASVWNLCISYCTAVLTLSLQRTPQHSPRTAKSEQKFDKKDRKDYHKESIEQSLLNYNGLRWSS